MENIRHLRLASTIGASMYERLMGAADCFIGRSPGMHAYVF